MNLPENKVVQLIDMMNTLSNGGGIPAQPPIIQMFNEAMDEKMLDYLIKMGTEPHTVPQLRALYHEMYGGTQADWDEFWKEMMVMSYVHCYNDIDRHLYQMTPIFPGWVELFTAGPSSPKRQAVLTKFMEFWGMLKILNKSPMREMSDAKTLKDMADGVPPKMVTLTVNPKGREVSLNQPLESVQEVLTAGDVYKLLAQHPDELAIASCFCRRYKKMTKDQDCGLTIPEESCMAMGYIATQLIENGTARKMTYEEAVQKMHDFEDKGCIHTTFHNHNNANEEEFVVCNCCPDCCLLYGGYRQGGLSKIYVRSHYSPKMLDESKCVGCNKCGKYCPTGATYYDKAAKKLVFDYEKCVGCGQCVHQCRFDVREMAQDQRDVYVKTLKPEEALD